MSVYVDDLFNTKSSRRWPYSRACHLFADSQHELMAFALSIGLQRRWLQGGTLKHFDLTAGKRMQALTRGAIPLSRRSVVERIKDARNRSRDAMQKG